MKFFKSFFEKLFFLWGLGAKSGSSQEDFFLVLSAVTLHGLTIGHNGVHVEGNTTKSSQGFRGVP